MQILKEQVIKDGQIKKLMLEDDGSYRVQVWTADGQDWDFEEGTKEEMTKIYDELTHIDDFVDLVG